MDDELSLPLDIQVAQTYTSIPYLCRDQKISTPRTVPINLTKRAKGTEMNDCKKDDDKMTDTIDYSVYSLEELNGMRTMWHGLVKTSRLRRNEIDNEIIRQKYQEVLKHTYWKDKHHSNRVFYKIVKERGLTYVIVNRIDLCNEKYQHEMSWPKDNMVSYSEPCCREEYMVALSHIKEKMEENYNE